MTIAYENYADFKHDILQRVLEQACTYIHIHVHMHMHMHMHMHIPCTHHAYAMHMHMHMHMHMPRTCHAHASTCNMLEQIKVKTSGMNMADVLSYFDPNNDGALRITDVANVLRDLQLGLPKRHEPSS